MSNDLQCHAASPEPSPAILEIRELNRRRTDFKLAQNAILLRAKAICRRLCYCGPSPADRVRQVREATKLYAAMAKVLNPKAKAWTTHPQLNHALANATPHLHSMAAFDAPIAEVEKNIVTLIRALPLWAEFKSERGLAEISFGQLIGEIGDPAAYRSPASIWKRMGVGRFQSPKNGEWLTQRNYTDRDTAIAAGYVARRRSVLFVIGDNLVKLNKGAYRKCYVDRKAYETANSNAGVYAEQAASMLAKFPGAAAASRKAWKAGQLTPGHIDKRAKRYMTKRLLRDMWRAARKLAGISDPVPAAGPNAFRHPTLARPAAKLAGRRANPGSLSRATSPSAPASSSGRSAIPTQSPNKIAPSAPEAKADRRANVLKLPRAGAPSGSASRKRAA